MMKFMRYLAIACLMGLSAHTVLLSLRNSNSDAPPIFLNLWSEEPEPLSLTPVEQSSSAYHYSHELINHDTGSSLTVHVATDGHQWGYALEYQRTDPSDDCAVSEPDLPSEESAHFVHERSDTISPERECDDSTYDGLGDFVSDSSFVEPIHDAWRSDDAHENHFRLDSLSAQELAVLSDMNELVAMFRVREQSATYYQHLDMETERIKKSMDRAWFDHQVDMDMKLFVHMMHYGGLYQRLLTIHTDDIHKSQYEFGRLKRLWPWKHRNGFVNRTPCRKEAAFIRFVGADLMRCVERCLSVRAKIVAREQDLPPKIPYQSMRSDKKMVATSVMGISPELIDDIQPAEVSIIDALESCDNFGVLADRLEIILQDVLLRPTESAYDLNFDIETLVGNSISIIRASSDLPVVIFHVAVVDRVLGDVQMQMKPQPTLFERSPQLLIRALEKFVTGLNPVTQLKNAVEFWVGTAHFVADLTVGKCYLTAEQYDQRIKCFWTTLEAIALSNLDQLTAEQWVDMGAQLAADMVYARGVAGTIAYLKEIDAVAKAQCKASCIADKLKRGFDIVLGKEPILVTPEGITWQVPQELQETMVFQQSANKACSRVSEVIKDTGKLIEQEAEIVARHLDYGHSIVQYEKLKQVLRIEEITSVAQVTKHGLEQLLKRGFSGEEILTLLANPSIIKTQTDGAKAFIVQLANNKFNIMILNEARGDVVTALKNLSLKSIQNLGNNYGWTL